MVIVIVIVIAMAMVLVIVMVIAMVMVIGDCDGNNNGLFNWKNNKMKKTENNTKSWEKNFIKKKKIFICGTLKPAP